MSSYTIDELISGYYEKAFSEIAEVPLPRFSLRHRMRMNKIFKQFAKNKKPVSNSKCTERPRVDEHYKSLSLHKRLVLLTVLILFLALATGFIVLFVSNGFKGTVHADNTHLFAFNTDNCPDKIEKVYTLSVVPEGYEFYQKNVSNTSVFTVYINPSGQRIIFKQTVKRIYNSHINTEEYSIHEINVNGCNAVFAEIRHKQGVYSLVIWDNNDYILSLSGNFNEDELVNLAISNEKCGF